MEGIEMEESTFNNESNDDICNSILSRFSNSTAVNHQHLCAVIGAMSQELKDHNLSSSPVAYFCATCSSLDRIASEPNPPIHLMDALLTFLSIVMFKVPVAVLKEKREFLSELVTKVVMLPSSSESAVVHGLKCVSHLLIHRDSIHWSDVSTLFNFLLGFLTDSRLKVRRQSHLCLRNVLINFQNSSLLASASEGVRNLLERFLLLAGGANANDDDGTKGANANNGDGTKGAQLVLYILDALKECLPLLSLKYKTNILNHFKTLLNMGQPLVTRRIMDGLNFLSLNPTSEVSPEALLEVLCTLSSLSASSTEISGDGMTFIARLLDAGMKRVFSLNRQMCVVKLPSVFNDLKDILASEHEEAILAATEALKSMINCCIDESLIKQGVDQITLDESRMSGPTIIEKICVTVESLLDYHYAAAWDRVFEVVSSMFHKLGSNSPYFMRGILKNMEDMQQLPDENFPFRKQLHACLGSALVAMGPETFLSLIPLNLEAEDLSVSNTWLFPILKQYIVGARLKYFTEEIFPMIERAREKAQKLEKQELMKADTLVYSLWSLLPSFCNYPSDTAKSFNDLEKHLRSKLKEEPNICGIICTSLQLLIRQNKNIKDSNDKDDSRQDMDKLQVLYNYSQQVATENLRALEISANNLLKDLSDAFLKSTKDDGGCLQGTIGDIASIAEKKVVQNLFKKKMSDLLKCTQNANKVDDSESSMQIDTSNDASQSVLRARLLDFAASLLPGLDAKDIDLLFQVIKPALQDVGVMQKKAYKVLLIMLKSSDSFVSLKLEVLLGLMVEILPCHSSAKRHRLDCLYFLIVHVLKSEAFKDEFFYLLKSKDESMAMAWPEVFVTEIILALKEANKKTRNRAYEILVEIAHALGDEERDGDRNNLYQFFITVARGLVGKTPHMISATIKGLACLAYEFSDLVLTAFDLLPSTFVLLEKKNREITKANLGLLKVLVAKSQAEGLQKHLRSVVECLFKWQDDAKNHFKAKVKLLLGMLITKCGLDAVKAVLPEEHMKLLSNIHKIKERKERNRGAKSEESRSHVSKATTSRQSRRNHMDIFSDFDGDSAGSDTEYLNGKAIFRGGKSFTHLKSAASSFGSKMILKNNIPEHLSDESDDEPLDLLDRQKVRSALRSENLKRKSRSDDDEMEVDSEGRLIIREEEGEQTKKKPADSEYDARSEPDSHLSARSGTKAQKRRRTAEPGKAGRAYTGKEYASRKAGGDIKRKDKLEPYAYWPLDRKMMSRRPQQRAVAKKGMATVVNMTKRLEGKSASGMLSMKSKKLKRTQKKGSRQKKM